jgi:signal transduction histidine kinase
VSHVHLGLFDTPPDSRQVRLGAAIVGLLYLASLPILLLGDARLPEVGPFIPVVDAIMFVGEVITATMLYSQASIFRLPALALLGTGYLYTALLLIPHALTFPGAFSPGGLLGAGVNTTAWIAVLRYPAFAIAVLLYVQFKPAGPASQPEAERRPALNIGAQVLAAILLAAAAVMLATSGILPPFLSDRTSAIRFNVIEYQLVLSALWVAAIVMLFRRRSSVLDLWLLVALAGWLLQSLLNMAEQGRFTAVWYWFYAVTLFSHLVVMLALMAESTRLYARLALSNSAWNREREARLMSIDAMAAAISHEVGQPLSAIGIHQNASLKWLTGERPNPERAVKSLRAAIEAETLAISVVKSLRATFARRTGKRVEVALADLVHATAPMLERELNSAGVSLTLALGDTLPPVLADRIQLQLVLINLLTNAIEAFGATGDRPRHIAIRLAMLEGRGVVLEVSDNGAGIPPEDMIHIFDPFFTTKPTGTGLGLSLCRIIVEAHGGRLWASPGEAFGATFHLELPAYA